MVVQREQVGPQRGLVCGAVRPERTPCLPVRAEAFVVGDGVLNDQGFDALRVSERHPKADRSAVVLHVKGVLGQVQRLGEVIHHLGDVVEGVRELLWRRRIAVPEARIVGSDHVKLTGQPREQRLEHARRRRKSVKQQKGRRVFRPGLAVEDREAVHFHGAVRDMLGHRRLLRLSEHVAT